MLKLAYIVQWDKMDIYALCVLEEFSLDWLFEAVWPIVEIVQIR